MGDDVLGGTANLREAADIDDFVEAASFEALQVTGPVRLDPLTAWVYISLSRSVYLSHTLTHPSVTSSTL